MFGRPNGRIVPTKSSDRNRERVRLRRRVSLNLSNSKIADCWPPTPGPAPSRPTGWTRATGRAEPSPGGDNLVFEASPTRSTSVNNLSADTVSFNSITIDDSGYSITGDAIDLAGDITTDYYTPGPLAFNSRSR